MSPRADCKMHWLLELACACGAAGRAFASACSGNNPNAAGDTANAMDTPKATALRTARATPWVCVRPSLTIFISFRFIRQRSEEHTSELQSLRHLVCRLLLEKKKNTHRTIQHLISVHLTPTSTCRQHRL